jgi:hypothetical protein
VDAKATGSVAPGKIGGHVPPKIAGAHRAWLVARTAAAFTLRGRVANLPGAGRGSTTAPSGHLSAAKASASKKTVLASAQNRPDVARKRRRWTTRRGHIDPRRLVFIDETWAKTNWAKTNWAKTNWAKTNMGPLRGWAPPGQRLSGQVPYGHGKTMTFRAALRGDRIDAPWGLDGPIKGASFRVDVERVLVPAPAQGDIVVIDNSRPAGGVRRAPLGSHKGKAIRRARRVAAAILPAALRSRSQPDRAGVRQAAPSRSISCEMPPRAPPPPRGAALEPASTTSVPTNAQIISSTFVNSGYASVQSHPALDSSAPRIEN